MPADLRLDAVRAQQDLDVLESCAGQMLVHHWLVHLLHKLQVQHMKVRLLQHTHAPLALRAKAASKCTIEQPTPCLWYVSVLLATAPAHTPQDYQQL